MLASTIPNCVAYDPTYAYELAVIIQAGLKRMYGDNEDVYLLHHHAERELPASRHARRRRRGDSQGHVQAARRSKAEQSGPRVRLLGSGAILREVEAAAELLAKDFGVSSEIWSVTSFTELRRDGLEAERWSMLHPEEPPRLSYVEQVLRKGVGPVVAATDYVKSIPDGVRTLRSRPLSRCSARTDSAARITAAGCARSSKSIAITLRSRA